MNWDRISKIMVVLAVIALASVYAVVAFATEKVIENVTIQTAVQKDDKDGNPYVRFIIREARTKTVKGQLYDYNVGIAVMCFSSNADAFTKAQTLKPGDQLNAIVEAKLYQGRTSYVILEFLN
jgi:Cu/Ag efflux protein CusF